MESQIQLVEHLIRVGALRTPHIVAAFRAIDRNDFVPPEWQSAAYEDYPLSIGHGQTISQPYTVAFMLELLQPQVGEKILDVGSGSAWTTALLAHIAGRQGEVFGTEIIPELTEFGKRNVAKYHFDHAQILQAGPPAGEAGKKLGLPKEAPFDKILASAAANMLPKEFIQQLQIGGTLVIPVRNDVLRVQKISAKETAVETFPGFAFVPLMQ
ncbi:MAG TPA: protein-L-isoaspartate O-methyltransferase [Candidatus Paceibacterota bacterium]